jgi:hypothetical protein
MAEVPYTGVPQVSPNLPSTPSIRPNVSADAFGAGIAQASARSGAELMAAGNELFGRAYAMQQLDQHAEASLALADATDQVSALHTDYRSTAGMEAKNGYEPFVKNINEIIDKGKENLGSDYARQIYDDQVRHMRRATLESAGSHAASEFKNYQVGSAIASADNHFRTAMLNPTDDGLFKTAKEAASKDIDQVGLVKGWGPEQVQDAKAKKFSQATYDRATIIARNDPFTAKKVLDDSFKSGDIDGEAFGKADSFIRTQRLQTTTRVETPKLLSGEGLKFGSGKVSPDRLYDAIIGVESGGNPRTVTAVTHKDGTKDRALGISQILESNLVPWLKEAGMGKMSAEEFLNDKEAQIKLTKFKLSQYQEQYGSANEAGRHWRGLAFRDSTNGETELQYLTRLNSKLAKTATSGDIDKVAMERAKELAPDDAEFHYAMRDRALAEHGRDRQIEVQEKFDNSHTVEAALGPGQDGKLPTSLEDIQDPKVREAWNALPDYLQERYSKVFAVNAKHDYAATAENQAEFRTWMGRMTDNMASAEDKSAAMDADFISMKLPAEQRQQLITARAKMFKKQANNPKLDHAMNVLQSRLFNAGITRKQDEEAYYQFRGTMHEVLQQQLEDGKLPDDRGIDEIGARLLRETVTSKGWLWDSTGPQFKVEVPDDDAAKIKQIYTDRYNREPTTEELQRVYAINQYNSLYGKKKAEAGKASGMIGLRAAK